MKRSPEEILQAGLHPTYDQLEMYAYHLPQATLANLVDIFISLSTVDDSMYNLCHMDDFKFLADMIQHIKLPLKAKYYDLSKFFKQYFRDLLESYFYNLCLVSDTRSAAPPSTGVCPS